MGDESADKGLTHVDDAGRLSMVDVSGKPATHRIAKARALLAMRPKTRDALLSGALEKGEALAAARVAGILAAKRTGDLIPLCHPLPLTLVQVHFAPDPRGIVIETQVACVGPTGVEMEALVAASVAGLTLYDMAKSRERGMVLQEVCVVQKEGGASGTWKRGSD